jgi:hypothetical protein
MSGEHNSMASLESGLDQSLNNIYNSPEFISSATNRLEEAKEYVRRITLMQIIDHKQYRPDQTHELLDVISKLLHHDTVKLQTLLDARHVEVEEEAKDAAEVEMCNFEEIKGDWYCVTKHTKFTGCPKYYKDKAETTCVICCENKRDVTYLCGHVCCCRICAEKTGIKCGQCDIIHYYKCPMCRKLGSDIITIIYS